MRANAAASAALRTAAYGFVSQTVAGDDTSDKADYELTDGLFPSDPEETKAVNMSKTQEALLKVVQVREYLVQRVQGKLQAQVMMMKM
jgi:hypothetical protein